MVGGSALFGAHRRIGERSLHYLGVSNGVVGERNVTAKLRRSYSTPWGERLSQTKFNTDGSSEESFYGYNPHSDVHDYLP